MKKLLLKWLGGVPKELLAEANRETAKANNETAKANAAVKSLQKELLAIHEAKKKEHPIVAVDEGDPAPTDSQKRRSYIAQVAGFHKDILSPKLKHLIRLMREEFEKVNRTTFGYTQEEYDLYLKGAINFGWLLHDWGDASINEMISYQQGENLSDEELAELKDKVK